MSNEIICDEQTLDDGICLALGGEIDLSQSPAVRSALMRHIQRKPARLVVDLSNVPYMDSSGVATLVEALQKQRAHGGLMILCQLQPKVRSIFEIARLDQVFTIVDDREKATSA